MTYQGHVENGAVVLDPPVALPEGAKVEVAVLEKAEPSRAEKPLWMRVVEIGASVPREEWRDVPADASINLDHYLYGAPKCEE
jgi:hypothetical protein